MDLAGVDSGAKIFVRLLEEGSVAAAELRPQSKNTNERAVVVVFFTC
jgi:hypothetical protein